MTTSDFSREGALELARALQLDADQFAGCIDAQRYLDDLTAQHRAAVEAGVRRTPTVRINGEGAAVVADALIEQVLELARALDSVE